MGISIWMLLIISVVIFFYYLIGRIASKAGYNPWWALIVLVPVVNLIMIWIFAFKKWPAIDKNNSAS